MRIVTNKILPLKGYMCIMVCGILFVREECISMLNESAIRHEETHYMQQKELWFVPFFIWYGIEWLVRLCQFGSPKMAYDNICFEKEAVDMEDKKLSERKKFNFIKYI